MRKTIRIPTRLRNRLLPLAAGLWLCASAHAEEGLRVLKDHCFGCHSEKKHKAGLVLETREGLLKGNDDGAVVDLESPDKSRLLAVLKPNADPHMPPKSQLSEAEVAALTQWLQGGAVWDAKLLADSPSQPIQWKPLAKRYRPVGAVAASADGGKVAVGRGSAIEIYTKLDDKEPVKLRELQGHRDAVQSLAWSPDGNQLASGGYRRAIVWEVETGEQLRVQEEGILGRVTGVVFAGEGKFLVLADSLPARSGRLVILDTSDWGIVASIDAHTDAIYALVLSPDGKLLASASADKLVQLWKVGDWTSAGALEGHTGYVLAAAFSPDGERIVTGGDDTEIKVWNVATRKQVTSFGNGNSNDPVTGLWWMLDPTKDAPKENDDWIVSISVDKRPRLFTNLVMHDGAQSSNGAKDRSWNGGAAELTSLAYAREARLVVAGDTEGGITFWNTKGDIAKRIE